MEPNASASTVMTAIGNKRKKKSKSKGKSKSKSVSDCSVRNRIVRLKCSVKNYDWGKRGDESGVARLYGLNRGVEIEEDKPYAEFWMGTHKNGPSYVSGLPEKVNGDEGEGKDGGDCGLSLKSWIEQNPCVLGDKVLAKFGSDLPFLSKVLSVERALSIQAHPDKKLAAVLHKKQPHIYKDENHKPEMALALTDFEALCGFISHEELKEVFKSVPEIVEVVGRSCADKVLGVNGSDGEKAKDVLHFLFSEIMTASKDVISEALSRLISRLNLKNDGIGLTEKEKLALRLETQYPADVGVMAAFLLNHIKLKPGEALYLGANEPHAYIYGECIECMATSDNVVRAGLTTKYLDVQILCSMLTYKQGFPDILQGEALDMFTTRYYPPFDEFEVDRCILPKGTETVLPSVPSPSIFLVFEGRGMMSTISSKEMIVEGDVLFTPADSEVSISTTSGLRLYRTGVNSRLL
ncbi:isomerase [Lithospermum erythrorhizon]|uniref:mannose-6-phosphate isomerase n=1 Tax=Lithospermum erythrorhizon TaxID=34254 RepID=A0AAV3RV13_LITER